MIREILTPLVLSLALTPLIRMFAVKKGIIDTPDNYRKTHTGQVPLLGGLAIYLSFFMSLIISGFFDSNMFWFWLGSTIILVIGLVDDVYNLSPIIKLLGQIAAALVLLGGDTIFRVNWLPSFPMDWLFYPFATVLWIVGICNAVNLIDGLDGLAAGVSAISALSMYIIIGDRSNYAVIALTLAIVCVGFIPNNLRRKRIFLGDAGSLFLGYTLAALSMLTFTKKATGIAVLVPLMIMALPIIDTVSAIMRRVLNGQPIMLADHSHIHHRLLESGFSNIQVLLILCSISVFFSIWAIIVAKFPQWWWTPIFTMGLTSIALLRHYRLLAAKSFLDVNRR